MVLAKREFESWFLTSAESLRGHQRVPEEIQSPDQPEEVSGAKDWLSKHILGGAYASTVDQTPLVHALHLALARRAPSFDKFYRDVSSLLEALHRRGR